MKVAVITGASRGIGSATAESFLQLGWKVINISRTANPHPDIINVSFDLRSSDCSQLATQICPILQQAETVSLIHCAAQLVCDTIDTLKPTKLAEMLQVNVATPILLTQALISNMPASSSVIVLGSALSEKGVPNSCTYTVAKHAILGFMRSLVQDVSARGIHACCVCPGLTETTMLTQLAEENQCEQKDFTAIQLMGRFLKPTEIAEVIIFCATHPVVNGALIHANMGQRN